MMDVKRGLKWFVLCWTLMGIPEVLIGLESVFEAVFTIPYAGLLLWVLIDAVRQAEKNRHQSPQEREKE